MVLKSDDIKIIENARRTSMCVMNCLLVQNEKFSQRCDFIQVGCGSHCFKSNISQSFPDFKLIVCT